eukprot:CAMPEP_0185765168 /NCGR_PEP_ID=MMETSP1174-20130828/26720_1 /TAXON_ID=35687 /ORGANISM="Dictyocha speculum, Strain CCMP1381" /LENGTH=74 /DNA_ID=CAMNT_0028448113 /DNA_START=21 /DNA_END=245 /DNA_ORIENTATION=+
MEKKAEEPKPEAQEEEKPTVLEVLEEDDEFEEFAEKDWDETAEDNEDIRQWEEDWDDTEIDDDFCNHLRAELAK